MRILMNRLFLENADSNHEVEGFVTQNLRIPHLPLQLLGHTKNIKSLPKNKPPNSVFSDIKPTQSFINIRLDSSLRNIELFCQGRDSRSLIFCEHR